MSGWHPLLREFGASEYQPRDNSFPFRMGIVGRIANVVPHASLVAVEPIVCATRDVDGVDETIFA